MKEIETLETKDLTTLIAALKSISKPALLFCAFGCFCCTLYHLDGSNPESSTTTLAATENGVM